MEVISFSGGGPARRNYATIIKSHRSGVAAAPHCQAPPFVITNIAAPLVLLGGGPARRNYATLIKEERSGIAAAPHRQALPFVTNNIAAPLEPRRR